MTDYAHIVNGIVANVIVLNDDTDPATFAQALGGSLVPLSAHTGWGVGWGYLGGVPVRPRALTTNRDSIPADGTTAAVVTYANGWPDAPATVTFTANGVPFVVNMAQGAATLSLTSTTPNDRIDVTVDALPGGRVTVEVT